MRVVFFLIALLAFPVSAEDCEGSWSFKVEQNKAQKRHRDDTSVWIPMQVTFDKSMASCDTAVTLHFANSQEFRLSGNGGAIEVQWLNSDFSQLRKNSQGDYYIAMGSGLTSKVWMRLPNTVMASPGWYTGMLSLKLGSLDQKTQVVRYRVKPVVSMNINASLYPWMNGSGSHYRVDLGTLKQGTSRRFYIEVASNTKVIMTLDSENGKLLHTNGYSTIPYQLDVNGQRINSDNKQRLNLGKLGSSKKQNVPILFTVGNTDFASAGRYSEQVEVTVSAY